MVRVIDSINKLKNYCEAENFKGWDPYDGVNSKIFQAIPFLRNSKLCRLVIIQAFKRSPVNFRRIALVPKGYNPKGIGLLLQGYCNIYKAISNDPSLVILGTKEDIEKRINQLAELLLSLQSKGYSGTCWGYNADWQARSILYFPKYTPNVVVTNFCATALMDAFEVTGNKAYLDASLSSAEFVINDLHRTACNGGELFSYSPLLGNDTVFNASLLASRLLSYCYHYTKKSEYVTAAKSSVIACCNSQNEDGSWVYGMLPVQSWIDSFHTGYNLDGLIAYEELTGDITYHRNIEKGFKFYIENFFENDGCPKYYHNKKYPIDIHCPGQLCPTLFRLRKFDIYEGLASKVINWTIDNMQDKKGFFYYQIKRFSKTKIPYMRWSNAFMLYSLSYYILYLSGRKCHI